jgi:uncharacterized membrane protein (UPF0127 family)
MENNLLVLKRMNGEVVCKRMKMANSFFDRLNGLMFTKKLEGFDGLLINPCNSIHTFFMLMSLDVIFLDRDLKIIKIIYDLKPWRLTWMYFKATQVLEMKAGTLQRDLVVGESLRSYV